ncbi:hypothetical protein WJX73_007418 [Symbiochloris irregularis]|uniref:Dystroglycan-type cadherin-like domain-containing protein n=1 Tax=Symbiochloris irregularis TaxID=706552 RepID=A0AAW1P8P6_9CHLO
MRWAFAALLWIGCAYAYPPKATQQVPTVAFEGGTSFSYQFNGSSFTSNKADGVLRYSLASTDGAPLPAWASFTPASRTLAGIAPTARDLSYNWTLSAVDRDGEASSQTFLFVVSVACGANKYRHFRFRGRAADAFLYGSGWFGSGSFLVCDISWSDAGNPASSFPTADTAASVNISGTKAEGRGTDFHQAFQQVLTPPSLSTYACQGWLWGDAWQASAGSFAAVDLGFNGCRGWPAAVQMTSPVSFFWAYSFPSAFTIDVASTGLQPDVQSPTWQNLLTVEGFRPRDVGVAYHQLHDFGGRFGLQPPAYADLTLHILGQPPSIVGAFPVIQVQDGQPLQYSLPSGVIQLNKPYGQLSYSFGQQNGEALPSWLAVSSDGTLSGTPQLGQDASYRLSVTGTDSDGDSNTTTVQLVVQAPCPAGSFRHFRVRGLPQTQLPYGTGWFGSGKFLACSVVWQSKQGVLFPEPMTVGVNISGSTQESQQPSYQRAFREQTFPLTWYNTIYPCNQEGDAWQVTDGGFAAIDLGLSGCQEWPKSLRMTSEGLTAVMKVNTDMDTFIFLDTDALFEQQSRICCANISAQLVTDAGLQQLPDWLSLQYGLFDSLLDTSVTHYYQRLTANYTLRLLVRVPCPAGRYRHFRVRGLDADPPYGTGWFNSNGFYVCAAAWQSADIFPALGSAPVNVSGSVTDLKRPDYNRAFSQLLQQPGQRVTGLRPPCGAGDAWKVTPAGFTAIDTGIAGCRAWPSALYLAGPISHFWGWSLPPSFTADASGAALQPAPESSAWQNLISVRNFTPTFTVEALNELARFGVSSSYAHTFPIEPPAAVTDAPPTTVQPIASVLIEIGMPTDYLINTSDTFRPSGKLCCPELSLSIVGFESSFPAPAPAAAELPSGSAMQPYGNAPPPPPPSNSSPAAPGSIGGTMGMYAAPADAPGSAPSYYGADTLGLYGSQRPGSYGSHPGGRRQTLLALGPNNWNGWYSIINIVNISKEIPVSAIGQYTVRLTATNPGSTAASYVDFGMSIVDYYQCTISLRLSDIATSKLTAGQQAIFQRAGQNHLVGQTGLQLRRLLHSSQHTATVQQ